MRHQDFCDSRGDAVTHQPVQGVHEVLPKADIGPHDELERREVQGREVRKAAVPGGEVDPIALGVQLEIGKHRRIGVEPRHLGLERFGAGNAARRTQPQPSSNTRACGTTPRCWR